MTNPVAVNTKTYQVSLEYLLDTSGYKQLSILLYRTHYTHLHVNHLHHSRTLGQIDIILGNIPIWITTETPGARILSKLTDMLKPYHIHCLSSARIPVPDNFNQWSVH